MTEGLTQPNQELQNMSDVVHDLVGFFEFIKFKFSLPKQRSIEILFFVGQFDLHNLIGPDRELNER